MTNPEHKQVVKHIRGRIAVAGLKARVRMSDSNGWPIVEVLPVGGPDARFTDAEQRTIRQIADANRLTRSQGMPIDVDRMTDGAGAKFFLAAAS